MREKKGEKKEKQELIYIYHTLLLKNMSVWDCHPTTFSCLCALASICCTPFLVCIHVYHALRPWEDGPHTSLLLASVGHDSMWPIWIATSRRVDRSLYQAKQRFKADVAHGIIQCLHSCSWCCEKTVQFIYLMPPFLTVLAVIWMASPEAVLTRRGLSP